MSYSTLIQFTAVLPEEPFSDVVTAAWNAKSGDFVHVKEPDGSAKWGRLNECLGKSTLFTRNVTRWKYIEVTPEEMLMDIEVRLEIANPRIHLDEWLEPLLEPAIAKAKREGLTVGINPQPGLADIEKAQ